LIQLKFIAAKAQTRNDIITYKDTTFFIDIDYFNKVVLF